MMSASPKSKNLKRAIIGATLLLKGDVQDHLFSSEGDGLKPPPKDASNKVRLAIPVTQFGAEEAKQSKPKRAQTDGKVAAVTVATMPEAAVTSRDKPKRKSIVLAPVASTKAAVKKPKAAAKPSTFKQAFVPEALASNSPARAPAPQAAPFEPAPLPFKQLGAEEAAASQTGLLLPNQPQSNTIASNTATHDPGLAIGDNLGPPDASVPVLPKPEFGQSEMGQTETARSEVTQSQSSVLPVKPVAAAPAGPEADNAKPALQIAENTPPAVSEPEASGQSTTASKPGSQSTNSKQKKPGSQSQVTKSPVRSAPEVVADPLPKPAFGQSDQAADTSQTGQPETATNDPANPGVERFGFSKGGSGTSQGINNDVPPNFTYDDELILQLQSSNGEIADTITAYGTRAGVYLPLGVIARFLDLPISISDDGNYASGWFLDEKQTLSINLRQGAIEIAGKELSLAKGDAAAFEGEMYIRSDRFSDLFPLSLAVDLRGQNVTVKTRVPFPFEQRIAREQQREQLAAQGGRGQKPRWPREETPYQAVTFPLIDAELRAASDSTFGTRAEGDLRMAGDLAFMTAKAFVSGTSRDGLTGARIALGRRDPEANLLGPLQATEFQFGDVSTIGMPLGLRSTNGRGAFITNAPLERASIFDTLDLRGELPEGYEVELYRNNVLVASTREQIDGQYRFNKVTLDFGLNVFRLVFFGPQGQRREEVRQYSVGDGRLGTGEFQYSFGMAQKDVNLFNVYGPNFTPAPDRGVWRSTAMLQYGLSRELTAVLGGAWFENRFGQNRWQLTSGLRTGIGTTAVKLDLGYESGGGKALELGLGGKIGGVGYTFIHAEYRGEFTDEARSITGEYLRRASEINLNTTVNLGGGDHGLVMPLYGQLRRYEFLDGRKQMDASLQGSLPIKGYMLSNSLTFSTSSTPGFASSSQLTGSFDLAKMVGSRLRVRAGLDYAVIPQVKLTGARLEADYNVNDRTSLKAFVSHALDDDRTQIGVSAIRRFRNFTLAFDGSYGVPIGDYRAALRLGFTFGHNPINGQLFFAEPGMASGGAIAARAFRDSNGNRRFDKDEELLSNVDFNTASQHGTTDKQGMLMLGGLGDGSRTSLTVDRATLPDLALAPVSEGIETIARAGRIHATDFPVQELSDIEGTVYFSEAGGREREVSGLRLVLVNDKDKAVGRSRTEADGSFFFEQIAPGSYTVQIDKNQAISLKIHLLEAISIKIGPKSDVVKQVLKVAND